MTKPSDVETKFEPTRGTRLTRRSLVAAGAILTTSAPAPYRARSLTVPGAEETVTDTTVTVTVTGTSRSW